MLLDRFKLTGRVIVITGGMGNLGRQYAGAALEAGAKVALIDRALKEGDALLSNPNVLSLVCDITDKAEVEKALKAVEATFGTPDGLVNNAALDSPPGAPLEENGPFETYPEESWDKVMDVNVKGTFLMCQVFGGAMAAKGKGAIVNVGSIYGVVSPDQSLYEYRRQRGETFYKPVAYSASKSAIMNLTRYLATYWAGKGVRVNTLVIAGVFAGQEQAFMDAYTKRMPIGRMAQADEYNASVVYLLSDASGYMTGASLTLDGGWTAW